MIATAARLVWLASYPSSGNTWMRIFLTNLLRNAEQPVDINELGEIGHAASRNWFDEYAGVEASDLMAEEIAILRAAVYACVAREADDPTFVKTHDLLERTATGALNISLEATRGVIYIIRNPLDVAVGFAHHRDRPTDAIVRNMAKEDYALAAPARGITLQLSQRLGSWSSHVSSWVDAPGLNVHVVRYEDMKRAPLQTFASVAAFSGLHPTTEQLERAVRFSDFRELRRQEEQTGFRERSMRAGRFFRRGVAGGWRDELTVGQAQQIIATHGAVMRRFGYLNEKGEVVD